MYFDTMYTNGVIAVKEKSLLKEKILRLCELRTDEAFRMLLDGGFGGGATNNVYEYEQLLQAETSALDDFIRTYAPSRTELEYFLVPQDFHNAKALFKARILGEDAGKMLVSQGLVNIDVLKACIIEKRYEELQTVPVLAETCIACEESLEKDVSGVEIGSIFQRGLYKFLFTAVKGKRALRALLSEKIDMNNILTALRSGEEEMAKKQYLTGGTLSEKRLQVLFQEDIERIQKAFADTPFQQFIKLCMTAKEKRLPYMEAERYCDGYDLSVLEKRKFDLVKNEPFLYYVYRRKAEIANVRIVLACKLAGLDELQIKNRLRK